MMAMIQTVQRVTPLNLEEKECIVICKYMWNYIMKADLINILFYLKITMRILVQRVFEGWVKVGGVQISRIQEGVLVLVGLTPGDNKDVVEHMVSKTLNMRLWENKEGKAWGASVMDIGGQVLAVSQFTLYGILKGNKPDFHSAMQAEEARDNFDLFVNMLKKKYNPEKIKTGQFQTLMQVGSVNNGPVTIQYEKMAEEKVQKKQKTEKVQKKMVIKQQKCQKLEDKQLVKQQIAEIIQEQSSFKKE